MESARRVHASRFGRWVRGQAAPGVDGLAELLAATGPVAAQTRQRLARITPAGVIRRISLHAPDARPIAKGRLGRPVEFGDEAQVVDNEDGVDSRFAGP